MDADRHSPTPEQAREQLAATQTASLGSSRDAAIHAIGTAVFGASIAIYMASQNLITGFGNVVLSAAFAAMWLGAVAWVERSARTVPRRARLWSRLGIGASFFLALGAVLPWLNYQAQTEPNTWPTVLVASAVVALPSLVAAMVIARGRS